MKCSFFQLALLSSLVLHLIFFGIFSQNKKKIRKEMKNMEVTYQKMKSRKIVQPQPKFQEAKLHEPPKEVTSKLIEPLKQTKETFQGFHRDIRDLSRPTHKMPIAKKLSPRMETRNIQRSVAVPMLQSEKITNPKYLSYNQNIRQKIRQRAYRYVDHPDFATGQVYISFVLDQNGRLVDIHILEHKTKANNYLRKIGLRSVREAAPFSAFPKDLTYPELTFNVIISFTVDD